MKIIIDKFKKSDAKNEIQKSIFFSASYTMDKWASKFDIEKRKRGFD